MTTTIATTETELRTGMRMSVDEFLDLPDTDDKRKMELDDGELYVMPRPRPRHQWILGELNRHFGNYREIFDEAPMDVYPDVIIALPSHLPRLFSPDLVVIPARRQCHGDRLDG